MTVEELDDLALEIAKICYSDIKKLSKKILKQIKKNKIKCLLDHKISGEYQLIRARIVSLLNNELDYQTLFQSLD